MAPLKIRLRITVLRAACLLLLIFAIATPSLPAIGTRETPQPLTGQASKIPWSGWWWPLRDSMNPNLYDEGGPLDKYDRYVLASRGYNPHARRWEGKAHGSTLMIFTLIVGRNSLRGGVSLGKYGRIMDEETLGALNLLRELVEGATPQDQIEEKLKELEEALYIGGLWWKEFSGDVSNPMDLLAESWKIIEEGWKEGGEVKAWFGHCNGLAAASVMEEEPKHDRILYGINFTVADLKGLLTVAWQNAYYDLWDATPRNFHKKLCEVIGNQGRPLIIDTAAGELAVNHPAYRYEITEIEKEGNNTTFQTKVWFANYASAGFIGTKSSTAIYKYSLTLDAQGDIVSDGTWISGRPDSIWIPSSPRPGNPKVDLQVIREINADVVITLQWDKKVNLNLRVISPQGEVSWSNPRAGDGRLDRDVVQGGFNSTESIFWPQGKAPSGNYTVVIEYYDEGEDKGAVKFKVKIVAGGEAYVYQGILNKPGEVFTKMFYLASPPGILNWGYPK